MDNRRRFVRFEVSDFLELSPLKEVARYVKGKSFNLSLMGMCFSSQIAWEKGHVLLVDYFIPNDFDSVKLKIVVVWSELIGDEEGYLTGAEIIDVEQEKEAKFINYYYQKLKEHFL